MGVGGTKQAIALPSGAHQLSTFPMLCPEQRMIIPGAHLTNRPPSTPLAHPCNQTPFRVSPGYLKSTSVSWMSGGCSSVGSGKAKLTV